MPANQWVKQEIRCQTLRERLLYLVDHCDGAIIMTGGIGTLSEFSLMWSFVQVGEISPRPIILVGGLWQRTLAAFIDPAYVRPDHQALITIARTVEEAVKKLLNM
jgi:predicted Rossmann-fold nucleotide-binding protein